MMKLKILILLIVVTLVASCTNTTVNNREQLQNNPTDNNVPPITKVITQDIDDLKFIKQSIKSKEDLLKLKEQIKSCPPEKCPEGMLQYSYLEYQKDTYFIVEITEFESSKLLMKALGYQDFTKQKYQKIEYDNAIIYRPFYGRYVWASGNYMILVQGDFNQQVFDKLVQKYLELYPSNLKK